MWLSEHLTESSLVDLEGGDLRVFVLPRRWSVEVRSNMDWEVVIAAPLVGAWKGYSGMRRTERKNILEFPDISNVGA